MEYSKQTDEHSALEHCDFIKVVLMALVVMGHSVALWAPEGWFNMPPAYPSKLMTFLTVFFGEMHIYCFTIVSGYLYAYLKFEKGKYTLFVPFVKNKVHRLLVPFVFVSVVWAVPFYYYFFKPDFYIIARKFLLAESPSQLWFLMMLFGVFMLVYPVPHPIINNFKTGGMLSAFIYVCGIIGGQFMPNFFQIFAAMQYFLFFWIGMQIRSSEINPTIFHFKRWHIILICAVLYIVLLVWYIYCIGQDISLALKIFNRCLKIIRNVSGSLMAFYILLYLAEKIDYKNKYIFQFLKEYNIVVYIFHQQIIWCVITLLNGRCSPFLMAFTSFIVSFGCSMLIAYVLGKFNITRTLVGLKPKKE